MIRGSIPSRDKIFSSSPNPSTQVLGPIWPPNEWVPSFLPGSKAGGTWIWALAISEVTMLPTLHATMAWLWTILSHRSALFLDITQGILVNAYQSCCTPYRSYLYASRNLKSQEISWPLKMGLRGCPEISARICHYTLRNIPEECRYHLLGRAKGRNHTTLPLM